MIKWVIIAALAATAPMLPSPLPAAAAPPAARPKAGVRDLPEITYAAHRGGALEVPENSMAGLREMFRQGVTEVLDVDVRMLRDGTLVAMHDATLDRTTDHTGPVRRLTARQWRSVRLVPPPWLGPRWRPERPPTLEEVLDEFGGRTVLTLEAKDPDMVPRLAEELKQRGLRRSVFVNTNHPEVARRIHAYGLPTQLWRSAEQLRDDRPGRWRGFVDLLDVDQGAREEDLRRALGSGIRRVWAHTVNGPLERDRMLDMGCDGIITDTPLLLSAVPYWSR